eukprot:7078185-Prymnesium_polylepis.1
MPTLESDVSSARSGTAFCSHGPTHANATSKAPCSRLAATAVSHDARAASSGGSNLSCCWNTGSTSE